MIDEADVLYWFLKYLESVGEKGIPWKELVSQLKKEFDGTYLGKLHGFLNQGYAMKHNDATAVVVLTDRGRCTLAEMRH